MSWLKRSEGQLPEGILLKMVGYLKVSWLKSDSYLKVSWLKRSEDQLPEGILVE